MAAEAGEGRMEIVHADDSTARRSPGRGRVRRRRTLLVLVSATVRRSFEQPGHRWDGDGERSSEVGPQVLDETKGVHLG